MTTGPTPILDDGNDAPIPPDGKRHELVGQITGRMIERFRLADPWM